MIDWPYVAEKFGGWLEGNFFDYDEESWNSPKAFAETVLKSPSIVDNFSWDDAEMFLISFSSDFVGILNRFRRYDRGENEPQVKMLFQHIAGIGLKEVNLEDYL